MSDLGRSRLDVIRSLPVGGESATTVDPVKLIAYRNAFDQLPADEQHACLARLGRGDSYEQIALDLGEASATAARGTVTRAMDSLLRDVFRGTALRSERLADLLGDDAPPRGDVRTDGAPADMSPDEEALLRELLVLAKTEPPLERWGKFTDLKAIGSGGFGTVYSAVDPVLQTRVALKLYHPHRSQRPTEELLSEARKLARVRHPNVVVVHGAEKIDGRVGVWMELVEGDTLEDEVRNGPHLDAEAAAEVGIALCQALEAVHAAGVVHGDIKAQNVVRGTDGRIVLMDFGAARFRDPSAVDANETRTGTPAYMAPELFKLRGDRLAEPTVQSDVYAVGVLLFYLVTRKFPVQGDSAGDIRWAHERGERMLTLQKARSDLPEPFALVVEQALSRNPDQRWLSAAELRSELEATRPDTEPAIKLRRVLQVVARVAALAGTIGLLGFISRRVFEVALHVDPVFRAGLTGYFTEGTNALWPFLLMWVVFAAATLVSGALVGARLEWIWRPMVAWLEDQDAKSVATGIFLFGAASWLAIVWTYRGLFAALDALFWLGSREVSADFSVLAPARHDVFGVSSALLSFILLRAAWRRFPRLEWTVGNASTLRVMRWATVAVAFFVVAEFALFRLVVFELFDVVEFQNRPAFVIGSTEDELLLYDHRAAGSPSWSVPRDDPALRGTGTTGRLFEAEDDATE